MDWKKYRESVGYTQAKMSKDATAWRRLADGYNRAAELLEQQADRMPGDTRPFAFIAALSLEQILKAILARKGVSIPTGPKGHELLLLAELAMVPLSDNQKKTLDLFTATLIWAGRYPAPNSASKWDEYQDFTFEQHVIRTPNAAMANRDTFPDWPNYSKIWVACTAAYDDGV
ncbi:hypothetical protein IVB08_00255 [Bradyrhizobium sp. 173]|uniref:hypothetical protein n=1 Tax=Bradyrhizobium sp. 173 TaxID=2782644 RepID=UPI001FF99162|nr:hypothetical protein [Bradyrhizobium sp. 173]MCK1562442.1 hypothetical protein [Bradyrhizobium sp. 173]